MQNRLEEVEHTPEALGTDGPTEDDVREALQKLDPLWDELFPAEKERIVKLLVEEVVVSPEGLLIRLRLNGLNSLVGELAGDGLAELGKDGQTLDVRVPMEFRARGGRKEIISPPRVACGDLPADADVEPKAQPQRPLWSRQFFEGKSLRACRWQRCERACRWGGSSSGHNG